MSFKVTEALIKEIESELLKSGKQLWTALNFEIQDDFTFLHHMFYKECRAGIIVCSLEKNDLGKNSFIHIDNWYNEIYKYCSDIPVVLFTNKVDLVEKENIDISRIQELVKKYNFLNYFLTSAKTGEGVIDAFNAIIENLYYKYKKLTSLD